MSSEDPNKFSANLKVPPIKIVLSSHQNNAVVNINSLSSSEQYKTAEIDTNNYNENTDKERNALEDDTDGRKKIIKIENNAESESEQPSSVAANLSSTMSSSSSSFDRSSSATPSSESESMASTSTIVSDQHQQGKSKHDLKEDLSGRDKNIRCTVRFSDRSSNSVATTSDKNKSTDISNSDLGSSSETTSSNSNLNREQASQNNGTNQRITRSSQRAAQQVKSENDSTIEEQMPINDNLDRTHELVSRKAKRRKGENQDTAEQEVSSVVEPPIVMAEIYPADYQLPSQNSFELYRDIRKRPYKKLMRLNHIQPKVPHGFKDYLINGGPYLLDGNKLGVGLYGAKALENLSKPQNGVTPGNRAPLRKKFSNLHHRVLSYQPSHQRHNSYIIPQPLEAPKKLQMDSPLYELFQDQEKARQQMRMQHLKERERSILTAEQEVLRAYNKAAIADVRQKLHLSACTYFYYQERYHYLESEKSGSTDDESHLAKDSNDDQDESFMAETDTSIDDSIIVAKEIFLDQLQMIDDKWEKIKKEMFVRHKNEADSLQAVQSLEWEWKAKEIGSCDVRVNLKIEPEYVPRVEIKAIDY